MLYWPRVSPTFCICSSRMTWLPSGDGFEVTSHFAVPKGVPRGQRILGVIGVDPHNVRRHSFAKLPSKI